MDPVHTQSTQCITTVAICARVIVPFGLNVVSVVPLNKPACFTTPIASFVGMSPFVKNQANIVANWARVTEAFGLNVPSG